MTLFQTSKMSFSTSVFRSGPRFSKGPVTFRVQRPIFKIKTIITQIKTPATSLKYIFFLCFHFELKRQINVVHSTLPLFARKSLHDFRPKCKKFAPVFRPKRRKINTLWGDTYPYGLKKGVELKKGKAQTRREGHFMPGSVNLLYVEPK